MLAPSTLSHYCRLHEMLPPRGRIGYIYGQVTFNEIADGSLSRICGPENLGLFVYGQS